jgi:hypothetical protein
LDRKYNTNGNGPNQNNYLDMAANGQAVLLNVYKETFLKEYIKNQKDVAAYNQ